MVFWYKCDKCNHRYKYLLDPAATNSELALREQLHMSVYAARTMTCLGCTNKRMGDNSVIQETGNVWLAMN
jgi:hypothetical protein